MTREIMRYKLNELRMMMNDGEHTEEQGILVDIIKALDSAEGEYIKKSELLQHVTTEELSDFKDCDVIHADEIDNLPTYSIPDSAEPKVSAEGGYIKKEDALAELNKWEWQELYLPIHFKENILDVLPTYSFPEVVHIKDEEELLKRLKECPLDVITPTVVFPDREKGEWIKLYPDHTEWEVYECNVCGEENNCDTDFCPNCGADMRGDKTE